jgi:uncharacterized protein
VTGPSVDPPDRPAHADPAPVAGRSAGPPAAGPGGPATGVPHGPATGAAAPARRRLPSWVGWAVAVGLAVVLAGFLLWAADRPADPYLVDAAPDTTAGPSATDPPGPSPSGRVPPVPGLEETGATLTDADGETVEVCLLVAESREQRAQGLMGVTDLGGYDGMLFRFDVDTTSGFWMKDTPMPLTVGYFDAGGAFVSSADMAPCPDDDCPVHPPDGPYRSAVEVPTERAGEVGLAPGTVLATGLACSPPR